MGINRSCTPYKQELSRNLNIFHLTAFGMNYILPFGMTIVFGFIAKASGKTVALPVILAFLAMLFTANSYVYMVKRNPVAGSLYSYVDALLGRKIGFLAGWILFLDYILIPTAVSVGAINYLTHYLPQVNYHILLSVYIIITGSINLLGTRLLANVGLGLLLIAEIVLFSCLTVLGNHIISLHQSIFSLSPFSFNSAYSLFTATTLAVFGYLGYDAISTLAEEAKNPERDIPRAIFLSVSISATTMFLLGYFGVLATPNITSYFKNIDWLNNSFFYIVSSSSSVAFKAFFTSGVILAMAVFNIVSTAAGARLLYGMGRDRVISRKIFGAINNKFKTPHNNILIIMLVVIVVGNCFPLDKVTDTVNFGAIVGFLILNFAVFYHLLKQSKNLFSFKRIIQISLPIFGCITMLILISSMQKVTLIVGGLWVLIGIIYLSFNKYLKNYVKNDIKELQNLDTNISDFNNIKITTTNHPKELTRDLRNCLNYEHWNTSDIVLNCITETDNGALIIISNKPDEFAGSIVAYNYNENYGYFGLFYIRPEFRNRKLGGFLTGAALSRWGNRAVACDSFLMQVDIYKRIGFLPMYENRRYMCSTKNIIKNSHIYNVKYSNYLSKIVSLVECDFNAVVDYDEKNFYTRRSNIISFWLKSSNGLSFGYLDEQKQIKGVIYITEAPDYYRIGPFFADSVTIAEALFYKATSMLEDKLCNIDMPLINNNVYTLINSFNLLESNIRSIRMHKGSLPLNNVDSWYGHLSIELG